ncbi:putative 4-coumarate-ligase 2 [Hyphodiscus hymeniophilus]|uniref:4-coumarate-ligase 2 n=1 Tax=Hyphodiscus hymeniophilus TaxID=353542 RepID=A0A9P6VFW6_9HELO|nr:putative 4-coumarate-ligase 2 [Hyphodiscus hymeniophilus]
MVTESQYPPVDIPEVDFWGFLFERDIPFPQDKVIYVNPETSRQHTFLDVKNTSIGFGHALETQWNWKKGDVLVTFAPNCIDTPALNLGTLWATGVVSPANPAYSAAELAFQLKDSESKAILTMPALLGTAFEAAKIAGIPRDRILVMGDEKCMEAQHFTDFVRKAGHVPKVRRRIQLPSDLAYIPYSSGTTGLPKGVCLTQENMSANLLQMEVTQSELLWDGGNNGEGDSILAVLPFYHVYGIAVLVHHPVFAGIKAIVLPKFALDVWCQAVQDHKITYSYVVPPILLGLSKAPIVDNYDLSSIKVFVSAAAPLTKDIVNAVWNRLKIPVKQAYGLTETSPGTHVQRTEDWQKAIGSVGRLLPNQTAKFVSEAGEDLPVGSTGEFWVKGPNIFAGYWKNPSATANCMSSDGYFKTGDIGYQDQDGNFYITDRLKELIKYKGFQVAPAELEGLLVGSDMVADACVVGIYDESQATELPLAFVVKTEKVKNVADEKLEKEICQWVTSKVANHKRLRGGIRFVDEIPKSAAGKILRRLLRDRIKEETANKRVKSKL